MKYAVAVIALGLSLHAAPAVAQVIVPVPEVVTTYYAPAPVTTYYAPAPVTTYYAPAPVTTYYAPTYSSPTYYAPAVSYYPATYYYVPRRVARRWYRGYYW